MASQGTPTGSPQTVSLVRKCLGKNKQNDCLQNAEHNNTRWECNFETQNKDEYLKHLKNILKRVKWRDLVEGNKPDKDGWYRCVYYSTDRHHVENHYHKGSADALTPSPQQVMRYKNYYLQQQKGHPGKGGKSSKRWVNFTGGKREADDDDEESSEYASREMKKLKQDASLLGFFQEQHAMADPNAEGRESLTVPDNMKIEDLLEIIEKKLELNHDMVLSAIEKLTKQGYLVVSALKNLSKEGWDKLDLPLAIEEEIKNQTTATAYNPWYGIPFAWSFHQGGYWPAQYNNNGQPMYYPYPNKFETQESVIGVGEVGDKDKDKTEEAMETAPTIPEGSATSQLVALEDKKENGDVKEQLPPLESLKVDVK